MGTKYTHTLYIHIPKLQGRVMISLGIDLDTSKVSCRIRPEDREGLSNDFEFIIDELDFSEPDHIFQEAKRRTDAYLNTPVAGANHLEYASIILMDINVSDVYKNTIFPPSTHTCVKESLLQYLNGNKHTLINVRDMNLWVPKAEITSAASDKTMKICEDTFSFRLSNNGALVMNMIRLENVVNLKLRSEDLLSTDAFRNKLNKYNVNIAEKNDDLKFVTSLRKYLDNNDIIAVDMLLKSRENPKDSIAPFIDQHVDTVYGGITIQFIERLRVVYHNKLNDRIESIDRLIKKLEA